MVNRLLSIGAACSVFAFSLAPLAYAQKSELGIVDMLVGKTSAEKADIKAEQITIAAETGLFERESYLVDLSNIALIDGGYEVLIQAWKSGEPVGFGADGSVEIERIRVFNPPVLVPDTAGAIVIPVEDSVTGE